VLAANRGDPVVSTAKRLDALSAVDLATFRKQIAAAPPNDPHFHIDREALRLLDAVRAAGGSSWVPS
jgi:hypothetical protein